MALYADNIELKTPFFMVICGKSNEGKTYFVQSVVDDMVKKNKNMQIIYVVNKNFEIEAQIAEQALKNKHIYIIRTDNIGEKIINFLTDNIKTDDPKLIIIDNFTYQLSLELLNFATFSRKYNANLIFISHTLHANVKISPRLKEAVTYFVFFYLPDSHSYKRVLPLSVYSEYQKEITHKSFKFLIYDIGESEYTIGKLPQYKIDTKYVDEANMPDKKAGLAILKKLEAHKAATEQLDQVY